MIEVDVKRTIGSFTLQVAFSNDRGITALFGRSGSGKSQTISLIAGLSKPDAGRIVLDERNLVDVEFNIFLPPYRRRIGLVFQDSHLFPHFSVQQNLMFGRWFASKTERAISFEQVVETLGIGHLLKRRPALLSGGERQRVAIGRALLSCPKLLLFDEPFAALDLQRRLEVMPLIERLRDEFRIPIVYVSHALEEVVRLASHVVVLEDGQVKATGDPGDVFGPAAVQAAHTRFDRSTVLTMRVGGEDAAYGLSELLHPAGTVWLAGPAGAKGEKVRVLVRATDVTLSPTRPGNLSIRSILEGRIEDIETEGPLASVEIALNGGGRLFAMATRRAVDELGLRRNHSVFALVKTVAVDERAVGIFHN
jgi:molybdate transport system ATP-binding protein